MTMTVGNPVTPVPRTDPDVRLCRVAQPLLTFAPTDPTVRRYRSGLFRTDLRRIDGRLIHTSEVRQQGLPAQCPALRLFRRDPVLPLPFLHHLVSFGDFIDTMERSDSHPRCSVLWLSLVRRPRR